MKEGCGMKKLGESLARGQPEWMQIMATIVPTN